jgi:hypothetical protein
MVAQLFAVTRAFVMQGAESPGQSFIRAFQRTLKITAIFSGDFRSRQYESFTPKRSRHIAGILWVMCVTAQVTFSGGVSICAPVFDLDILHAPAFFAK